MIGSVWHVLRLLCLLLLVRLMNVPPRSLLNWCSVVLVIVGPVVVVAGIFSVVRLVRIREQLLELLKSRHGAHSVPRR